jgi:hypothetical protein
MSTSKGNIFKPNYEALGLGAKDVSGKLVLNDNGKVVKKYITGYQIVAGVMTSAAVIAVIAAVVANRRSKNARGYAA